MGDVDLGALQQQLQQHRSNLADDILARLPSQQKPSNAPKIEPARRSATLGVGAKSDTTWSAADQKLRAQLGKGKKREHEPPKEEEEEVSDGDGKAAAVGQKSQRRRVDPFAKAEAKHKAGQAALPPEVAAMSKAQRKKWNKKQRLEAQAHGGAGMTEAPTEHPEPAPAAPAEHQEPAPAAAPAEAPATAAAPSTTAPASAPLTALQSSMLNSLKGARFRSINERLYTNESQEARRFMLAEPQLFNEYHDGFRQQVRKWPTNPVDRIADLLRDVKRKKSSYSVRAAHVPGALVVDVGAGEAGLAQKLAPSGLHVLSYDLLDTPDGWVRGVDAAQIHALPLPGVAAPLGLAWEAPPAVVPAMADVVVFCLSLMGTNWVEMIAEAWRVLRPDGELLIAEVASRLGATGSTDAFVSLISALGFRLDWADTSNTHFVLCKFSKHTEVRKPGAGGAVDDPAAAAPLDLRREVCNAAQAREVQDALIAQGASVLKPCLYKRR